MPRIREYTNQQGLDAGPLASAAESAAQAGYYQGQNISRSFSAVAKGVDEVGQHVAQNETSKLAADFATAQAELTTQWADTARTADPNDHDVANRFMSDVVRPRLEKMGDGLMTQQAQSMYQKAVAGLHADLFSKTAADQSQLAGVAAVSNYGTTTNELSNAARADATPAGMANTIKMHDILVEGLVQSYGLPREKALEMQNAGREKIAASAFYGMADANPEAAKVALASGQFSDYVDGTTAKSMAAYADAQTRAETAAQRAAEADQRRQQKDQFTSVMANLSSSTIDPQTGALKFTPEYFKALAQVGQMPGAEPGAINAARSAGEAWVKEQAKGIPAVTDPHTYEDFANRMYLDKTDTRQLSVQQVDEAKARGELNDKDYSYFRRIATEQTKNPQVTAVQKRDRDYIVGLKGYITHSTMLQTFPQQDQRWKEFQEDGADLADKMRSAGKSQDDIRQALRQLSSKYTITTKEGLGYMQNQIGGGNTPLAPVHGSAPARMPNESPAAYLKRTSGL